MTKSQLVAIVAAKAHTTQKAAQETIDVFLDEIAKALRRRERVTISGFGTFESRKVEDKPVIVPGTNKRMVVKSHWVARFSPGTPLKKAVK